MRLSVGAATDTGRVRDHNEDAFAVRPALGLFVVCDGMGGAAAGEVASAIAVRTILEQMNGSGAAPLDDLQPYLPHTRRLAAAVRRSNQDIYAETRREPGRAGMGTTVVAACVDQNVASIAHVGDSRAYLWHDHRLEPLTRDHSLVEEQVRAGLLAREAGPHSAQQNVLVRALGCEPEVAVDVTEIPMQPGDYLLLCSDGLTRTVPETTMAEAISELREPQRICDRLVDAANRSGGPDNVTVVVVEVEGRRRGPWTLWRTTRLRRARCRD